jgi:hypothetical protein
LCQTEIYADLKSNNFPKAKKARIKIDAGKQKSKNIYLVKSPISKTYKKEIIELS